MLSRIGLVSGFTMLSRVLGLGRDMLTSAVLGTTVWNSAFIFAFTLPNLFRRLLGEGALTAALMPNLSDELDANGREGVHALANKTLSWLLAACSALIVIVWLGALAAEGFLVSEKWVLASRLTALLFPYVALICGAAIVSAALNLFGRFGVPALTAVWLNLSILLFLGGIGVWVGDGLREKTLLLCAGVLVGGLLQLIIPVWALMREGWRPRLDFAVSPRLSAVLALTLPGFYGAAAHQIAVLMSRGLALFVSDAGASLLYYANRLVELPLGVFTIAISTVIFPSLSRLAAGTDGGFAAMYRKGLILSAMIALPAAAGLCAIADDAIRVLFQRGLFSAEDTRALAPIVAIFAAGMPFYAFLSIELRAFYAMKDMRTPVRAASVGLVVNLVLSLALIGPLGAVGLAVASNVSAAAQTVYLHQVLRRRRSDLAGLRLLPDIARMMVAALGMGVAVWGVAKGIGGLEVGSMGESAAVLGIGIPLGIGVYFALVRLVGLSEAREAFGLIGKALRRRR